ncbi:hypothetical protein DVS77_18490 [Mycolicibacterium moriokaense]|nr:hypothetical protein DVS77_18490 [Mycolicibacterium moriokaense]
MSSAEPGSSLRRSSSDRHAVNASVPLIGSAATTVVVTSSAPTIDRVAVSSSTSSRAEPFPAPPWGRLRTSAVAASAPETTETPATPALVSNCCSSAVMASSGQTTCVDTSR